MKVGLKMNRNSKDRRVFVSALNLSTTEADLDCFFAQYGVVTGVLLKRDRATGVPWGTAYIEMETVKDARTAIKHGNYQMLNDYEIRVGRVRNQS